MVTLQRCLRGKMISPHVPRTAGPIKDKRFSPPCNTLRALELVQNPNCWRINRSLIDSAIVAIDRCLCLHHEKWHYDQHRRRPIREEYVSRHPYHMCMCVYIYIYTYIYIYIYIYIYTYIVGARGMACGARCMTCNMCNSMLSE